MLEEEAGEVAEDPFMGWEGWPPKSVVIVTIVLGIIFEIVFCIGFWQFWCLLPPPPATTPPRMHDLPVLHT
eukprot:COSAG01_NODE_16387_length_1240_cov_1.079755_3_plen_71_part_00